MASALRTVGVFRKKCKGFPADAVGALTAVLASHVAPSAVLRAPLLSLLGALPQPTEPAAAPPAAEDKEDEKKTISKLPENEMFVGLLVLTLLLDLNHAAQAVPLGLQLMERVGALKRRTLDPIAEKVYFYASWAHEVNGTLVAIRSPLLAAHRTAGLHHNATCQATLLNLLLRNYQVRPTTARARRQERSRERGGASAPSVHVASAPSVHVAIVDAPSVLEPLRAAPRAHTPLPRPDRTPSPTA